MRKALIAASINVLVIIAVTIFYLKNREYIDFVNRGGKIEHKVFYSPTRTNKFTILLHIDGAFVDYKSYIYIIDGEYVKEKIPQNTNYIKFPNSSGIYVEWENDNLCNITCDEKPEINNLKTSNYKINLIFDDAKIRSLKKSGKVIRYYLKPIIPKD